MDYSGCYFFFLFFLSAIRPVCPVTLKRVNDFAFAAAQNCSYRKAFRFVYHVSTNVFLSKIEGYVCSVELFIAVIVFVSLEY